MNLRGEVSWDSLEQQFSTHLRKTVKGLEEKHSRGGHLACSAWSSWGVIPVLPIPPLLSPVPREGTSSRSDLVLKKRGVHLHNLYI